MSVNNQYNLKWADDLRIYMPFISSFILEGNVHDLHPYFDEGGKRYRFYSLEEMIARTFSEHYCVVYFDHNRKAGGLEEPAPCLEDGTTETTTSTVAFNSFEFFEAEVMVGGRRVENPNIKLFGEFYEQKYMNDLFRKNKREMRENDLSLDMLRMKDTVEGYSALKAKYPGSKPFMFILKDVSRFMTSPGRPSQIENPALTILFQTMQEANQESRVLLFVDKNNDLPTWFEASNTNPTSRKIYVSLPDDSFRRTFFMNEVLGLFDSVSDEELIKQQAARFSAYTESYTLVRLIQLRHYIADSDDPNEKNINNIVKTILNFDLGKKDNPWKRPEIREEILAIRGKIESKIKGQNHVISKIQDSMNSAIAGLNKTKKNDRRPVAVFLFAGPTGVGKTETSKILAESVLAKEDAMIRFDMSEYRDESSDTKLFGAPPGYVGYDNGGALTKAIKEKPFSVLLFDEIEKASSTIWDKFLQILGDGRLTDAKGETVYFSESVIIFTSNLGITATVEEKPEAVAAAVGRISKAMSDYETTKDSDDKQKVLDAIIEWENAYRDQLALTGIKVSNSRYVLFEKCFEARGYKTATEYFDAYVEETVKKNIKDYFDRIGRREILGRIGENNIIVYHFINKASAISISNLTIDSFIKFLKNDHEMHINLMVTDAVRQYIFSQVTKDNVLDLGGRGVVETTEIILRNHISEIVLNNLNKQGFNIEIDYVGDELTSRVI